EDFTTIPPGRVLYVGGGGPRYAPLPLDGADAGEHKVTVRYVSTEDGKQFKLTGVWTGTVGAPPLVFRVKGRQAGSRPPQRQAAVSDLAAPGRGRPPRQGPGRIYRVPEAGPASPGAVRVVVESAATTTASRPSSSGSSRQAAVRALRSVMAAALPR